MQRSTDNFEKIPTAGRNCPEEKEARKMLKPLAVDGLHDSGSRLQTCIHKANPLTESENRPIYCSTLCLMRETMHTSFSCLAVHFGRPFHFGGIQTPRYATPYCERKGSSLDFFRPSRVPLFTRARARPENASIRLDVPGKLASRH